MTGKRFKETISTGIVIDTITGKEYNCKYRINDELLELINKIAEENKEVKNDEKQLSIDFLGYKMKLKKILQKRYNYAEEQCQKNLNNPIIHRVYDIIRYDVKKLAEEMGVDLE